MEKYRYPFKRPYASKAIEEHRLAAIMFTDIVGYTEIMGKNERKALELLEKNQRIQKSIIEMYGGRVLKEIGDGMLVSFNSSCIPGHTCPKLPVDAYGGGLLYSITSFPPPALNGGRSPIAFHTDIE